MDDGLGKIKVIPDYFEVSTPSGDSVQKKVSNSHPKSDKSLRSHCIFRTRRKFKSTATMLNLFKVRGLPWGSSDQDELDAAQMESLRSELALLEEREAHLKAQLENIDEILRSARLCGYLYIRTVVNFLQLFCFRWTALPGEPPPLDDADVDDWLPRFVVLQGDCIFFYLLSTDKPLIWRLIGCVNVDLGIWKHRNVYGLRQSVYLSTYLSPQDSTLLSDIVEVGPLPSFTREDEQTHYAFYILTCHGLRYECSNISKIQVNLITSIHYIYCFRLLSYMQFDFYKVDSWLVTLQSVCSKSGDKAKSVSHSSTKQNNCH
ncbi:hypothetical protein RJ641_035679 [Dillenia turbinata]|uniref:Uncharacterized protein n=1 Tax=Dillenia turbinata TaxID=194707 RepID=A0AAN8VPL2_9MAGN